MTGTNDVNVNDDVLQKITFARQLTYKPRARNRFPFFAIYLTTVAE